MTIELGWRVTIRANTRIIIIHITIKRTAREFMMFDRKGFQGHLSFRGAAMAMTLGLVSCSGGNPPPEATTTTATSGLPEVVVSSSILCDFTQQIAGNTIALNCLMERDRDPHTYQTTPSDRQAMETAALILYDGYGLVPTIEELVGAIETSAPKVAVYEAAVPDPILAEHHHHDDEHHDDEHHEDEHHEDEHHDSEHHDSEDKKEARSEELAPDPHVWHDVSHASASVAQISSQLARVNPEQAPFYAENATQLQGELEALDIWVEEQVATIPEGQKTLITTHDGFNYYIQAYGFQNSTALQGISTEEQPTATRVKELVEKIEESKVPTIFAETSGNDRVLETVAREAGVRVAKQKLFAGSLGAQGSTAETYIGAIASNTCAIVNGLGGECTPFQARESRISN